ncbi:MAG TPA: hypothetical protein VFA51_07485 [Candidatus Udaeobacter sp.]|nr:hypothetical protein [Candidatus Udaeobacter sp.]
MTIRDTIVRVAGWIVVMLPALWLLTHPVPVGWLLPFARDPQAPNSVGMNFWPLFLWCLGPSLFALRDWKWRRQVTFGWIAILFCALEAYCFNTAKHPHPAANPEILWGFFPNTDGQIYLNDAVEIAEGVGIRFAFGPRQLWPGFLSLLHTWTHGDLKLMLSLLTLMQAAVTFVTWEMIYLMLGRVGAFVWLGCVTQFYRSWVVGTFFSEQLGLPLGMLAAVILLYGWKRRTMAPWLIGLLCLTFAFIARPACFFLVPVLVLGTFWRFRQIVPRNTVWQKFFGTLALRKGVIAVALVSLCIAANTLSYWYLVKAPRTPSNFWMMVYGMAKGGNWVDAVRNVGGNVLNLKQISTVKDEDALWAVLLPRVKQAAIEEATANAHMLLRAAPRAWNYVIVKPGSFFESVATWWSVLLILMSAMTLALAAAKNNLVLEDGAFYWLVWIGVFISLPLAPPWDSGIRIYAATDPLLWLTPAAFCSWCCRQFSKIRVSKKQSEASTIARTQDEWPRLSGSLRCASTAGVVLAISSVVFPDILFAVNRNNVMPRYSDIMPLGETSLAVKEIPGSLIRRNRGITVGPNKSRTLVPRLAQADFDRGVPWGRQFAIGEFMKELPINSYIALLTRPRYLICDRWAFRNGSPIDKIPLQEADWMAYKYMICVSKNVVLTAKQVMILCPSAASHEIFWQPAQASSRE